MISCHLPMGVIVLGGSCPRNGENALRVNCPKGVMVLGGLRGIVMPRVVIQGVVVPSVVFLS